MIKLHQYLLNTLIIIVSLLLCLLLSLTRLPGMEILGIGPNWLVIWLAVWSVKRTFFQSIVAGLVVGLILDGMTSSYPSYVFVYLIIGYLSAWLQKQRHLKEDIITLVLAVFGLSLLANSLTAIQYVWLDWSAWERIWLDYQKIALASAILSSLWTPVLYYPLNRWWEGLRSL